MMRGWQWPCVATHPPGAGLDYRVPVRRVEQCVLCAGDERDWFAQSVLGEGAPDRQGCSWDSHANCPLPVQAFV